MRRAIITIMHYRPSPDVIAQRMGQEIVLFHLRTNRFYELNHTGARLWELLGAQATAAQIQERLGHEFAVAPEELAREVDRLFTQLIKEQLVSSHASD